ncbi:hypothetical protein DAPPUDRAFT_111163 [Daphnia pulex]|uniref:Uncharacterized protein n=1 Tax=Daphnia pulex TaxID=6669 RepID=E9H8C2_DAPPU|nr:hypothetical protein DAPPUDRAFT_111163 [Daphnia pulex]|eukprot:EFX72051.1 hypothetical protein DAPPUDRAFT_111163 [Daphnia pulex]
MKKSRQKNNTLDLIDEEALVVPPPLKRRGRTPKENYFCCQLPLQKYKNQRQITTTHHLQQLIHNLRLMLRSRAVDLLTKRGDSVSGQEENESVLIPKETTQDNNNIPSPTTHSQPKPHAEESNSGSSDEEDSVSGQEENEYVGDAAEVNSRTIQLTEVERAPTFEENQILSEGGPGWIVPPNKTYSSHTANSWMLLAELAKLRITILSMDILFHPPAAINGRSSELDASRRVGKVEDNNKQTVEKDF